MVVLPASLGYEKRRVLPAVVMVGTIPSPLEQAPESLDSVGVGFAVCIALRVLNNRMRDHLLYGVVGRELIGNEKRTGRLDGVPNEPEDTLAGEIVGNLGNNLAATLYGSDNRSL